MAIKLRKPERGEDRLSWCKGVKITLAADDGHISGSVDVQFKVLSLPDFQQLLAGMKGEEADASISQFLADHIADVKGLKDENGEDWPTSEAVEFLATSADVATTVFEAYTEHVFGGKAKRASFGRSHERPSR